MYFQEKNEINILKTVLGFLISIFLIHSPVQIEEYLYREAFASGREEENSIQEIGNISNLEIIKETNKERIKAGLGKLSRNKSLEDAAQKKAEDMAEKGYFSHESPDGNDAFYWIRKENYSYLKVGENLAVKHGDIREVIEAWMSSAPHRANILEKDFSEIGVGISEGFYQGKTAVFIAVNYGQPI